MSTTQIKYQNWHVWTECKNGELSNSTHWILTHIESAPTQYEAIRRAAAILAKDDRIPLKSYAYDVGYTKGPQTLSITPKTVYEVEKPSDMKTLENNQSAKPWFDKSSGGDPIEPR